MSEDCVADLEEAVKKWASELNCLSRALSRVKDVRNSSYSSPNSLDHIIKTYQSSHELVESFLRLNILYPGEPEVIEYLNASRRLDIQIKRFDPDWLV